MKNTWIKKLLTLSEARRNLLLHWLLKNDAPVFYIGGSETLPTPLSAEEEAELLTRLTKDAANVKKILIVLGIG